MRATWEAVHAAQSMGADLSTHLSQPVTLDALRRADAVFTMTEAHRAEVLQMMPGAERKTFRLDPEADIDDPIGSDEAVYRQVAERLEKLIRQRLSEIAL
jgi:protein-tyrosine phosphatase